MMRIHVVLALALALLSSIVAFNFIFGNNYTYHGVLIEPPQPAGDFTLTDVKSGQPFHLEQERGEITLLYFGYTNCPDVCPTTMSVWKQVKKGLGSKAGRVRFIFISVDPERDRPEVLAKYMSAFDDAFIGLSGRPELISGLAEDYGIWLEKEFYDDTAIGYAVNHTASTFLINPQGALQVSYPFGTPAEAVIEDIEYLLR